jgi:hypothetical protein
MMRVISSPSSSTTVPVTLIFCIEGPQVRGGNVLLQHNICHAAAQQE